MEDNLTLSQFGKQIDFAFVVNLSCSCICPIFYLQECWCYTACQLENNKVGSRFVFLYQIVY